MSAIESIRKKHAVYLKIDKEESEQAQIVLTPEEFKAAYSKDAAQYYRKVYPDNTELQLILLDKLNRKLLFFAILILILLVFRGIYISF